MAKQGNMRKDQQKGFNIVAKDIAAVHDLHCLMQCRIYKKEVYFILILYLQIKCKDDLSWINSIGEKQTHPSYFLKTVYLHYLRSKPFYWWAGEDVVMT